MHGRVQVELAEQGQVGLVALEVAGASITSAGRWRADRIGALLGRSAAGRGETRSPRASSARAARPRSRARRGIEIATIESRRTPLAASRRATPRRLGLELGVVDRPARRRRAGRSGHVSARWASQLSRSIRSGHCGGLCRRRDADPTQGRPARGGALRARSSGRRRRRLRGHPLRARRGHREDHDQPARGAQRLPPADPARAPRRLRTRPRRHRGRRPSSSPGAGDEAFCSGGDQRIRGDDGYIGDDEVAQQGVGRLDVGDLHVQIRRLPEARGGDGRGLRRRRRAHPAPGLRHDDRRRQRPVRPDGPAGRQLRRRLRRQPARPEHRRQEGEGDSGS